MLECCLKIGKKNATLDKKWKLDRGSAIILKKTREMASVSERNGWLERNVQAAEKM